MTFHKLNRNLDNKKHLLINLFLAAFIAIIITGLATFPDIISCENETEFIGRMVHILTIN